MTKSDQLQGVIKDMEASVAKLPLAQTAKDIVPPEGNPEAEIIFIGEAAGYHESVQRRPFVGAAGKLLTQSLTDIGLNRQDVWISNVLKTRPPNNRDPQPSEIEAYAPYLDQEINILKPKIIVTLGRFSMAKFLPEAKISQVHGQARWVNWHHLRFLVMPMYHPAAALRSGEVLRQFKADFAKLRDIINKVNHEPTAAPEPETQTAQLSLI